MIERLTNRPSIYGSPFKNSDSGRLEYDPVNKAKLQRALNNYLSSEGTLLYTNPQYQECNQVKDKFEYSISSEFATAFKFGAPLFGLLFGKFIGDAYLKPSSIYLKGVFAVLGAHIMWRYYQDVEGTRRASFWLRNYEHFPVEIQQALKSNDARYARRWLFE